MSVTNVTCKIGDKEIKFETGKLALQAPGSVVVTSGDTNVLVTTVANETVREGIDFFPLTVDVEERMYSAGKIPGGFFRREGRQTEKAILACRLIDRPLRPSFNEGFRCETQIIATVLSVDNENEYDVLSLNAASLGLQLAGVPLDSPIGAVRMSLINDEWVVQATNTEMEESVFDMVIAGNLNEKGEVDIVMVEAGASDDAFSKIDEGSKAPTEDIVADGIDASKEYIAELIKAQAELVSQNDVPSIDWPSVEDFSKDLKSEIEESFKSEVEEVTSITDRKERSNAQSKLEATVLEQFLNEEEDNTKPIQLAFKSVVKNVVRDRVISGGNRLDGRSPTDIRDISAEINLLPKVHGSSLFLRGETQVLNVTTLGMGRLEQMLDTIDTVTSKRYMHHYNFPPYSTGEAYMMRGPKRREIGHGALAEKALVPVIPTKIDFPYTIRVVSEAISSNGSTSQASVCASSLSLMAAGVPIREHVAGIAMGLISKDETYVTLTDILGAEDALGDMDFKVAGTRNVITALQLDMKIEGLPSDVLRKALNQAMDARHHILDVMEDTISEPAESLSGNAPRLETVELPKDKIGEVIGPKGKNIRKIEDETGVSVEIDDEGVLTLGSTEEESLIAAKEMVMLIIDPPEVEVGTDYEGEVVNIATFGAFVNLLPGKDGLLHISKFHSTKRVSDPEKVLEVGQKLMVHVDSVEKGRVSLSLKEDLDVSGDDKSETKKQGNNRDNSNNDSSKNRKRVSFEDDFEKGL
ncbi:MAG: polyribonucleotide nucleotidyltransferase [Actinobacteria bacterium]|nr:polyribonucleotide nucleotidyltransferase [Actinomycetota bacterium]|tara:strand:- start:2688 stop:4946 length:2259 start_codon:yes stop_codon:yes gene_type:complete